MRRWMLAMLLILSNSAVSLASDGRIEINQACAENTGCMVGDAAGFPVIISEPGSYVLTSNLDLVSGSAIGLAAIGITLDLNGFTIAGPGTGFSYGVYGASGGGNYARISNGTIKDFDQAIALGSRKGVRVNDITAHGNNGSSGLQAIYVGFDSIVKDSYATENGAGGIRAARHSIIENSIATNNGSSTAHPGFFMGISSVALGNNAAENAGTGFQALAGSLLVNNSARLNGEHGFAVDIQGALIGNVAVDNTATGLNATTPQSVAFSNNVARSNGTDASTDLKRMGSLNHENICDGDSCQPDEAIPRRKFYLTQFTNDGANALTACAAGYHMASLWEIHDPSNLEYDTTLGVLNTDAGEGPPTNVDGWIRTGHQSSPAAFPGTAQCAGFSGAPWDSNSSTDPGTVASLAWDWTYLLGGVDPETIIPWTSRVRDCNISRPTWCVQD